MSAYFHCLSPARIGVRATQRHRHCPVSSRYDPCPLFGKSRSNDLKLSGVMSVRYWRQKKKGVSSSAYEGLSSGSETTKRRKIVEHLCLLKAKGDLSDEEKEDMLDHLYTTQYQISGIVAASLGQISAENAENYTHAVYLRFQRKEDLSKFYEHPLYLRVIKQHVIPYCHELVNVDFESEVEDDILPIFRKGEEFNHGIEFMLLIAFKENANGGLIEDALGSLVKLTVKFPSLVAQATQGFNFNLSNKEYTHAVVIRFRSFGAYELFMGRSGYQDIWNSKLRLITKKSLSLHFSVDPVGTEIM